MVDLKIILEIKSVVLIFVMVKVRIGYFVEVQILEVFGIDYIDESEVLIFVDEEYYIDKWKFKVVFVCGVRDLGEVLRRI